MNVGRNDKCPCGSGKKYKKCCLDKDTQNIPVEILEMMKNIPPPEPFEKGGFLVGRHFIDTTFKDKRIRAVGGSVYSRPLNETFQMFLLNRLAEILGGKNWHDSEQVKSEEQKHQLFKWFVEFENLVKEKSIRESESIKSIEFTGNVRALLSIAYDCYSLQHCGANILPKLIKRLKDKNQFQGAKYEIAVGGLVTRSGFEITWMNDEGKHCEFIGKHRVTGDQAAFEAKSHHRDGVLGRSGVFNVENAGIKIFDHIREALEQSPKHLPLVLFDDLNLPLTEEENTDKWLHEVDKHLQKVNFYQDYKDTNYSVLFITNFSWHFHEKLPPASNEAVAFFHTGNKFSLKPETILSYLKPAADQYGFVPAKLEEFSVQSH